MAYVEEPCSQCGLILPKNQLIHAMSEVQTGRISGAVTTGTYASGKPRYSYRSGQQIFQTREEWLCPNCRDERLAREAAARRARLIGWSLAALSLVVVLAFLRLSANPDPAPAPKPSAAVPAARAANSQAPVEPAPALQNDMVAVTASTPAPAPSPDQLFVLDGVDLVQNPAFRAAAREALETGEVVLWGERNGGEVSVGPLSEASGQTCRSLTYTVAQRRSADIFMCRTGEGRWIPR